MPKLIGVNKHGNTVNLGSYQQTKVKTSGIQAESDLWGFSPELDFIRWPVFYAALRHHLPADVLMTEEWECDKLLVSRLQITKHWQYVKNLKEKNKKIAFLVLHFKMFPPSKPQQPSFCILNL